MALMDEMVLELSRQELFFLSGLMGSEVVLGLDDPFRGYLTEEIEEVWNTVKTSLVERGVLIERDGELQMDDATAVLIAACCLCEAALLVTEERSGLEYFLHFGPGVIVEKKASPTKENTYQIRLICTFQSADEVILDRLRLPANAVMEHPGRTIPSDVLGTAWRTARAADADALLDLLIRSLDTPTAQALSGDMLLQDAGRCGLVCWNGKEWLVDGIQYICGSATVWVAKTGPDGTQVTLAGQSTEQVKQTIRQWIARGISLSA